MTRPAIAILASLLLAAAVACAPSVSDHDNRIFATAASVKLSAHDLASAYAVDQGGADSKYRGRVIEVSGVVRNLQPGVLLTLTAGEQGQLLEASLHEDAAPGILKTVAEGQRVMLKCFCEGFNQRVRLKSCVAPDPAR